MSVEGATLRVPRVPAERRGGKCTEGKAGTQWWTQQLYRQGPGPSAWRTSGVETWLPGNSGVKCQLWKSPLDVRSPLPIYAGPLAPSRLPLALWWPQNCYPLVSRDSAHVDLRPAVSFSAEPTQPGQPFSSDKALCKYHLLASGLEVG